MNSCETQKVAKFIKNLFSRQILPFICWNFHYFLIIIHQCVQKKSHSCRSGSLSCELNDYFLAFLALSKML